MGLEYYETSAFTNPDKSKQSEALKRMMASERTQRDLPEYEEKPTRSDGRSDEQIIQAFNYASGIISKSIQKRKK